MKMYIWPDGDWVADDDDYCESAMSHKSDDFQTVIVSDNASEEELEELAASVHKHGYVTPEAINAFNHKF